MTHEPTDIHKALLAAMGGALVKFPVAEAMTPPTQAPVICYADDFLKTAKAAAAVNTRS